MNVSTGGHFLTINQPQIFKPGDNRKKNLLFVLLNKW